MRRALFAAFLLSACTPTKVTTAPVAPAPVPEPEPEPEMHPHPEIPPDDLAAVDGAAPQATAADAAVIYQACRALPPPPPAPPPRILSGPPVTNRIPPELVMRPVRARAACMHRCYVDALARNAALAGRVQVRFVVDTDGWVRTARVERDETGDATFASCIAKQFVGLEYPEPDGGRITVIYPVVFSP
jgi:hypothetical protein